MSNLNWSKLEKIKNSLKKDFVSADPFPHIIIEDFINKPVANQMAATFPSLAEMKASSAFSGVAERKSQLADMKRMTPLFRSVFKELMSKRFRLWLSEVTGIKPLLPDLDLVGGGLHQGGDQSFLDIHADFNKHPKTGKYRRINILVYLNKNWDPRYGGGLELWDKKMTRCIKNVVPEFNRCLIFATDKYSHHGYAKMKLPSGLTRKSIAAYYYSDEPAVGEDYEYHNTLFQARPNELRNKFLYPILTSPYTQGLRKLMKALLYGEK